MALCLITVNKLHLGALQTCLQWTALHPGYQSCVWCFHTNWLPNH